MQLVNTWSALWGGAQMQCDAATSLKLDSHRAALEHPSSRQTLGHEL